MFEFPETENIFDLPYLRVPAFGNPEKVVALCEGAMLQIIGESIILKGTYLFS